MAAIIIICIFFVLIVVNIVVDLINKKYFDHCWEETLDILMVIFGCGLLTSVGWVLLCIG